MDIRKFFAVSDEGRSSTAKIASTKKDKIVQHKAKSKKRTALVLSDSDSEDPLPSVERVRVKKRVIKDDSVSEELVKKNSVKKSREELALKATDVDDFFGSAPVRRQNKYVTGEETATTKSKAPNNSIEAVSGPSSRKNITSSETKSPRKSIAQNETVDNEAKSSSGVSGKRRSKQFSNVGGQTTKVEFVAAEKKHVRHKEPKTINSPKEKVIDSGESEKRRKQYLQYRQYLDRRGPQALGSKDIPEGKPDCLSGLTFVITGVLESFERDETKMMIERYKGKVTTSLSKNTSYLVVGRDPGPAKIEKAQKLGTRILDENQLIDLIADSGKNKDSSKMLTTEPHSCPKENIDDIIKKETVDKDNEIEMCINLSVEKINAQKKQSNENSPKEFTKVTKRKTDDKATSGETASMGHIPKKARKSLNIAGPSKLTEINDTLKCEANVEKSIDGSESSLFRMWVDKYKPSTTKQIIGQQGDRSNMRKLQQWLLSWHKNHSDGKKPAASKWYTKDDGSSCKAALLSGPPGVGKTTTAQLVCKECNFDYIEMNASDTRSKKSLKELVEGTVSNKTLINYASGETRNSVSSHHAIIMDEVDGMAGTQDRGGVQELITLIKCSKVPIICICNDRSSPKIRSLSNYCYDLRFQRPRVEQMKSAMMSILYKENIQLAPNILQDIIVASNQDIRQVLHSLSLWCAKKQLSADQAKCDIGKGIKNVNIGPFDALRKIFSLSEAQQMSIHDKSELFFTDYLLIPLFVQENYVSVQPSEAKHNIGKHLQLLSGAADSICDGDLVEKQIRTYNNWSLLPLEAIYASVIPGEIMRGHLTQMINFPSWLGKNSTVNHMKRTLQQLHSHMRLRISANKTGLHLDQLTLLRNKITKPLIEKETDGIGESISVLSDYCLLREDVDSIIELTQWPGMKNPMSNISPKVKSAFTRMYNKEGIMNPYSVVNVKKSRRKDSNNDLLAEGEGDDVSEASDDGTDDDDISTDAMVKVKKNSKKKTDDSLPKKKGKTRNK